MTHDEGLFQWSVERNKLNSKALIQVAGMGPELRGADSAAYASAYSLIRQYTPEFFPAFQVALPNQSPNDHAAAW
jgi:hypothetical protein